MPPRFGSAPGVDPQTARYAIIRDILLTVAQRNDDRSTSIVAGIEADMRQSAIYPDHDHLRLKRVRRC